MRCAGQCCVEVYISSHTREEIRRIRDGVRLGPIIPAEAALVLTIFRPVRTDERGHSAHRCNALTPTGCALSYEDRPRMCSLFPYGDVPCHHCGCLTDAEARGVALQVVRPQWWHFDPPRRPAETKG